MSHSRAVGDDRYVGLALHSLALHAIQENDQESARAHIQESRRVWQQLGSSECMSLASSLEGDLARSTGAHAEAAAHYREALRLLGQTGPRGWRFEALHKLGHATGRLGNTREARALFTEALLLCGELGDRRGAAQAVAGMACVMAQDEPQQAVRLLGAATAAAAKIESRHNLSFQADYDHSLCVARAQLGDEAFDLAWTEGQCMTLEQAVIAALDTTRTATTAITPERTDPTWQE